MKPRTKLQIKVDELSDKLKPLSSKQEEWIYNHVFSNTGYKVGEKIYCTCCGETFKPGRKKTCPSCGTKLEFKHLYRNKSVENVYCTLLDSCKEFQVVRHFVATRRTYKTKDNVYCVNECIQHWIAPDGREVVRSLPRVIFSYDRWLYGYPMEIRRAQIRYNVNSWIIPHGRLSPIVRRDGVTLNMLKKGYDDPETIISRILSNHDLEMLLKTGQYKLFEYCVKTNRVNYQHAIRICHRNKYIVQDAAVWNDYIGLLEYFGLDTHNAHYVCPESLIKEHDKLALRKRREIEKRERKEKIADSVKYEAAYKKAKGVFFGLEISNGEITISPLKSVREFAEEGVCMHHCVYDMNYFEKKDSLILSAKNSKGERLETIEYDLKNNRVLQSRSYCNGVSPKHEEILRLMKTLPSKIKTCIIA